MKRLAFCALLCALPLCASADPNLGGLLKAVENRYNHAQSLTLDFSETYAGLKRPSQRESGVLYLRKPGRMRWDYTAPQGKVFLSDGKDVYLYTPDDRRAEKSKLKTTDDMRAPLAFLLGRLDFNREFQSFETRSDAAGTWIVAEPKSRNLAYSKVEFLATDAGEIRAVRVIGQDGTKLDFVFANERLNAPVAPSLFVFKAPAGVQVVEAEQ